MDKIDELLTRGVENIIPGKEELEKVLRSGKKLRIYQGFDPTSPDLHIGHLAGLRKLAAWQDLGHEVIFLIGNFTAMVGDPSGKDKTRPLLSEEQVQENGKTYKAQAAKVLKFNGKNPVLLKFNGDWLGKLSAVDVAKIASYLTIQQVMERDMFQKRFQTGGDVSVSEFLYPLMQGYDSVAMDVDVEIGGNDQFFNMMTGRDLMHKIKQKNKFVMSLKLIVDSLGKKIGKTEGNAIGLLLPASQMFGMLMTLDDKVIGDCFEGITTVPMEKVTEARKRLASGENPMILKKELAWQIVSELHSPKEADEARDRFENTFQKGNTDTADVTELPEGNTLLESLVKSGLVLSRTEAKRLVDQKAIEKDGVVVEKDGPAEPGIYKIGKKKFLKIT